MNPIFCQQMLFFSYILYLVYKMLEDIIAFIDSSDLNLFTDHEMDSDSIDMMLRDDIDAIQTDSLEDTTGLNDNFDQITLSTDCTSLSSGESVTSADKPSQQPNPIQPPAASSRSQKQAKPAKTAQTARPTKPRSESNPDKKSRKRTRTLSEKENSAFVKDEPSRKAPHKAFNQPGRTYGHKPQRHILCLRIGTRSPTFSATKVAWLRPSWSLKFGFRYNAATSRQDIIKLVLERVPDAYTKLPSLVNAKAQGITYHVTDITYGSRPDKQTAFNKTPATPNIHNITPRTYTNKKGEVVHEILVSGAIHFSVTSEARASASPIPAPESSTSPPRQHSKLPHKNQHAKLDKDYKIPKLPKLDKEQGFILLASLFDQLRDQSDHGSVFSRLGAAQH